MKTCLIRQPAGIGDIIFTQKIAKTLIDQNRCSEVIWPVVGEYDYLDSYTGTDRIRYINEGADFKHKGVYLSNINTLYETDDLLYIPLQYADQTTTLPDCRAHGHIKYKFCNELSHSDWKEHFNLTRNSSRETTLIERLNVPVHEKYNLINQNYGSPPHSLTRQDIKPDNDYKCIYMDFYDGIHLFDWLGIAERAHEIHTVETSLCYLLEKINVKNVHMYSKYTVDNDEVDDFGYIKSNYDSSWIYEC